MLEVPEIFRSESLSSIDGQNSIASYYSSGDGQWPAPPIPTGDEALQRAIRNNEVEIPSERKGAKPSIFNRYSIFFYNNTESRSKSTNPENYMDSVDRISQALAEVRLNPTAKKLIEWSSNGTTNAVEYAIEDFLWCKNYGQVPNNYLITLRRFPTPVADDIFDVRKVNMPDIGRMLSWVDGTTNKWDSVGLSWTHSMNWKPITADLQTIDSTGLGYGKDQPNSFEKIVGAFRSDYSSSFLKNSNELNSTVGYDNRNATYGPLDVINKTTVRDRGLEFTQKLTLVFEYKLKSIDGINPKVAFIDLLSNILIVTSNRGPFWGGDIRYYGSNSRRFKPIGDPKALEKGDWGGYLKSVTSDLSGLWKNALGGASTFSFEGISNLFKNVGGNFLNQLAGQQLDKMGRPGVQAIDSLLTGDTTGSWHVMVGNPANPIMSVGNLILKETKIEFGGALGIDDFPTELKVTCELEPAMPRDRVDIISMFHRNDRTYLTSPPVSSSYTGNVIGLNTRKNGGYMNPGGKNATVETQKWREEFSKNTGSLSFDSYFNERFPNHLGNNGAAHTTIAAKEIG